MAEVLCQEMLASAWLFVDEFYDPEKIIALFALQFSHL